MPPPNSPLQPNQTLEIGPDYQIESVSIEDASDSNPSKTQDEMRQRIDQRERAAMILGSWEQLSWQSRMYGEVC